MRRIIQALVPIGGFIAVVACSSDDSDDRGNGRARWRCATSETAQGIYCECLSASDEELTDAGYDPSQFALSSCPTSDYKCCESRSEAQSTDGVPSCICWNPETIPFCDGEVPIVDSCPGGPPDNEKPSDTGWCCATSGGVCLCRDDQPLPCEYETSCPQTHECCIAGPDSDGNHCSCYSDQYLSQVSMTCEERADSGEAVVSRCPN